MINHKKLIISTLDLVRPYEIFRHQKRWWKMGYSQRIMFTIGRADQRIEIGYLETDNRYNKVAVVRKEFTN